MAANVSSQRVPGGVVHMLSEDLREALVANPPAFDAWRDITALARNEFICWVEDARPCLRRNAIQYGLSPFSITKPDGGAWTPLTVVPPW